MATQQVYTGGRAKLKINGQLIGWASGVSWTEELTQEAVDVLDRMEPAEYAITGYRVTLNFRFFRIDGNSLSDLGLWPAQGRTSEELRTNLLNFPECVVEVEDSHGGKLLKKFMRCKPQTQNVDVTPRGLIGKNATFTAIYASEEVDGV